MTLRGSCYRLRSSGLRTNRRQRTSNKESLPQTRVQTRRIWYLNYLLLLRSPPPARSSENGFLTFFPLITDSLTVSCSVFNAANTSPAVGQSVCLSESQCWGGQILNQLFVDTIAPPAFIPFILLQVTRQTHKKTKSPSAESNLLQRTSSDCNPPSPRPSK